MKYEVIGQPRIESEYSDQYQTVMVIDLKREDGVTGDVWIIAGVPDSQQGSSDAARTQYGYQEVWVFGDSVDMWCPECFQVPDADGSGCYYDVMSDIIEACCKAALTAHREAYRTLLASQE
jgi:hypothetical protein